MPTDAVETTGVALARISNTRRENMVGESKTELVLRNSLNTRWIFSISSYETFGCRYAW